MIQTPISCLKRPQASPIASNRTIPVELATGVSVVVTWEDVQTRDLASGGATEAAGLAEVVGAFPVGPDDADANDAGRTAAAGWGRGIAIRVPQAGHFPDFPAASSRTRNAFAQALFEQRTRIGMVNTSQFRHGRETAE
jgi:hypothetical protein